MAARRSCSANRVESSRQGKRLKFSAPPTLLSVAEGSQHLLTTQSAIILTSLSHITSSHNSNTHPSTRSPSNQSIK
jgi:hypothetical protein